MKILHIYTSLDGGGVERFLLNYYKHMDRSKYQFDIVVPGFEIGILEEEFNKLGANIYHVPRFSSNKIKHVKDVIRIIKNGNYDIAHTHGYKSILALLLTFIIGIKIRIVHSHMAFENETFLRRIIRLIVTFFSKRLSNVMWSCGIDAGNWLFGKNSYEKGEFKVIHNAVETSNFLYNPKIRDKYRKELGILDTDFVVGNVARLSEQKNQKFLLEIFSNLSSNKEIKLFIVGSGELEEELKNLVRDMKLTNVKFLGSRNDVPNLLMVFDLFILPSKYEGLPVSLIESQASGLYAISSNSITQEVNITNLIKYINLKSGPEIWAKEIINFSKNRPQRETENFLAGTVYDIELQAKELEILYTRLEREFIN